MKKYSIPVIIIGSGPAGLLLARLLHNEGIESVLIEKKSSEYVLQRIRAGVLEHNSVKILQEAKVAHRLEKEAITLKGFEIRYFGDFFRMDLKGLTGKVVTAYGQTEITKDLMEARMQDQPEHTYYNAEHVQIKNVEDALVEFTYHNEKYQIQGKVIAGCDGFHGVSRQAIPKNILKIYLKSYDFGWLGLLSDTKPVSNELVYTNGPRGFSLSSMRSKTRSRHYLQCPLSDSVENWSDESFWEELKKRLGPENSKNLETGVSLEKSIAPLKSFACSPISYKNLHLAGDAAHIVPPTGAKGLNLAICDVKILAEAIRYFFCFQKKEKLQSYSQTCLRRVWKVQRFSWFMSYLMHQFHEHSAYEKKIQKAEFDYLKSSENARKALAENYTGLPIEL